jgi:hypothetical protein
MVPYPGFIDLDDLAHRLLVTHRLLLQFMKKPPVPKVRKILYVIETDGAPCAALGGHIAILYVGGVNDHAQQQAERIDQDLALASCDFLARIVALRVERRAALALRLSMIATLGLASRLACSRVAT